MRRKIAATAVVAPTLAPVSAKTTAASSPTSFEIVIVRKAYEVMAEQRPGQRRGPLPVLLSRRRRRGRRYASSRTRSGSDGSRWKGRLLRRCPAPRISKVSHCPHRRRGKRGSTFSQPRLMSVQCLGPRMPRTTSAPETGGTTRMTPTGRSMAKERSPWPLPSAT